MTKSEMGKYKRTLESKQVELSRFLRNRDGIAIDRSADALDEVQRAAERELAIQNLDREFKLLQDVRSALCRIGECTYGVCLQCEGTIGPRRLAALPWTPFCIKCQEAAERGQEESGDSRRDLLSEAA